MVVRVFVTSRAIRPANAGLASSVVVRMGRNIVWFSLVLVGSWVFALDAWVWVYLISDFGRWGNNLWYCHGKVRRGAL